MKDDVKLYGNSKKVVVSLSELWLFLCQSCCFINHFACFKLSSDFSMLTHFWMFQTLMYI